MAEQQKEATAIVTCPSCKKRLKKAKRYYRNGAYYCNRNCWKAVTQSKPAEQSAEKAA
ncbi:MAG: hypothetical protein NUV91_06695 [Candidatus Omnitrophica bacterium]|nr:hypothetical protein [Candidatus Omnitrophota bacterium]